MNGFETKTEIEERCDQIIKEIKSAKKHYPEAGVGWTDFLHRRLMSAMYMIKALDEAFCKRRKR